MDADPDHDRAAIVLLHGLPQFRRPRALPTVDPFDKIRRKVGEWALHPVLSIDWESDFRRSYGHLQDGTLAPYYAAAVDRAMRANGDISEAKRILFVFYSAGGLILYRWLQEHVPRTKHGWDRVDAVTIASPYRVTDEETIQIELESGRIFSLTEVKDPGIVPFRVMTNLTGNLTIIYSLKDVTVPRTLARFDGPLPARPLPAYKELRQPHHYDICSSRTTLRTVRQIITGWQSGDV